MTIAVPTYKTQADPKFKIFPLHCWLILMAEDAILLDKTRAVLWHNYRKYIWQKEKKQTIKHEMTESDTSPARASG